MNEANFMHGWARLVESLAMIGIIVTALSLMLGIEKPADALKHIGAILGIVIVLMLIPGVLANLWSGIPLWQRIGLAAIGFGVWLWGRPRRQTRSKRGERRS